MSPVGLPFRVTSGIDPSRNLSPSIVISPDPLIMIIALPVAGPVRSIMGVTWPVTERPRQSKLIEVPTKLGSKVTLESRLKVRVSEASITPLVSKSIVTLYDVALTKSMLDIAAPPACLRTESARAFSARLANVRAEPASRMRARPFTTPIVPKAVRIEIKATTTIT
jgi:hypothetical protein